MGTDSNSHPMAECQRGEGETSEDRIEASTDGNSHSESGAVRKWQHEQDRIEATGMASNSLTESRVRKKVMSAG